MRNLLDTINYVLEEFTQHEKLLKKELKALKKLCDIRMENIEENDDYISLQNELSNIKKEINIYKKIKKLLMQLP